MKKLILMLSIVFVGTACVSTLKYNTHIDADVSVGDLKKDVVYTKNKLLKKHVDLDWYVPQDQIVFRLDSFQQSLTKPMKPNEFYAEFSKVISSFGHGHTVLTSLVRKPTSEERKKYKDSKNPLNALIFKSLGDRLMLSENFTKDSMLPTKVEVLGIDEVSYHDFYTTYKDVRKGDGFIRTFSPHFLAPFFKNYATNQIGWKDSITLTMRKGDSIFTHVVKRNFPKKKTIDVDNSFHAHDSLHHPVKQLTKEERLLAKKVRKQEVKKMNERKSYFGYESSLKRYTRTIDFPNPKDSTTAVLKIRNFTSGESKKGYPAIFDSIKKLGIHHLILDLRDNGGGSPDHINELYSYLTTSDEPVAVKSNEAKVKSKTTIASRYFIPINPIIHTVLLPVAIYGSTKALITTNKKNDNQYYYKINNKKTYRQREDKFTGDVYVLINGLSYSASSIVAAALQHEGKAIFVGEETGGDYNGTVAGLSNSYKLPNSKISLRFGVLTMKPNTQRELKGRGVLPQIPIEPNFDAWLEERDEELEWVLRDIEHKKGKVE